MMTSLSDSVEFTDLLHSAQETVEGVAFSPDSGVSSCSDSEPSSPVLSRHLTQLTNAKLPGSYTDKEASSPDWHQQQSQCGVYPCGNEEPQSAWQWQDPAAVVQLPTSVSEQAQSTVRREWVETKAGIQVCHTGDGNAQVRLNGGLTYDIDMDIDIPNFPSTVVKTEKLQDAPSRLYEDSKYQLYTDDMNNNNYMHDTTLFQNYQENNCNSCYLNRTPSYAGHCVTYPAYHQDAGHQSARAESPNDRLPSRKRQSVTRTERLWEFILRLLGDPNYNPDLIEWADREDGMFRLNNSKSIAHMWGMRKNNVQMTYEKLSRALRYYYHRRILEPVLGKKLVYRFGPNATQVWANRVYKPQGTR